VASHSTGCGYPPRNSLPASATRTFLIKVKSHRGEPINEPVFARSIHAQCHSWESIFSQLADLSATPVVPLQIIQAHFALL
jgi:hypothetical protein